MTQAGEPAFAADALDDRTPRRRRDCQGNGFQAAVGARTGGVEVIEVQALLAQRIQIGREVARIAITAHVLGAEALDGHQYDVGLAQCAGVGDGTANIQRVRVDKAGVGFTQFGAQLLGDDVGRQAFVKLGVVQFVVTERGKELIGAIAGQFVVVRIAALGARAVLADQLQAEAGEHQQAQGVDQTATQCRQRRCHRGIEGLAQSHAQNQCKHRQQAQQLADRVRLQQVVQYLIGVHQVIDGDKVEAHAKLIPEQPFGHRGEQHGEQADSQHRLQEPAMATAAPQGRRAEQQIQAKRQGCIGQETQVVEQTHAKHRQQVAADFIQVGNEQHAAGEQENQ